MGTKRTLTITETAARTGLSPDTLRYYERIGLIDQVARGSDGRRRYQESDLAWLEFLLRLRTTGMPIRQMRQFAELRRRGEASTGGRLELLRRHRAEVTRKLTEINESLAAIDQKIDIYERMLNDGPDRTARYRAAG